MAKKKLQAKRKQQVRIGLRTDWLKPMLALVTVVASAGGLTLLLEWMNNPREWPVQSVHIEGGFRHLQRADIQNEVAPLASDGFFAMNVAMIQQRIQQLPWVDQVSVRRVWPDKLDIQVREQQPVAHWGARGFLNARAQVFEPEQPLELAPLPHFEGPEGYEWRVLEMYRRMQALLKPLKLGVGSLQLDARRTWRVQLSNGLTLEVGRSHPVQRIARFVRVYPAILAAGDGRVLAVDLRYSNGFAVRWQAPDEVNCEARRGESPLGERGSPGGEGTLGCKAARSTG
ncbi:MAG: cell division protein FtsQ/DivIB [Gammaproteobacteria bacterium]|nr:MAG: cell division protein FtsQ/DivIB [Gammaproteobacteria bacterium]